MRKVLYQLSEKCESYKDGQREYFFRCFGCNMMHSYTTHWSSEKAARSKNGAPTWSFNGDMDKPSFRPSLIYKWKNEYSGKDHVCHLYVTDGKIQYLGDCTHCYAGKTVDMKDLSNE